MAASRVVTLPGGLSVTVREITVAEVRAWLVADPAPDPVRAYAFQDFSLDDVARMTDASPEALEAYAPSDLGPLVQAAQDLNPHFFRPRAALAQVTRALLAESWPTPSTAPPADLSSAAMPVSGDIPGAPT